MSFVYDMADTWNAIGTTFNGIKMNVTDGAAGNPVAAAASQLINLQTNGTQRFGVRMPHLALAADVTPFLNMVDIWNTSGIAVGIQYNVTNTASNAASKLADFMVGGTSQWNVTRAGAVTQLGVLSVPVGAVGAPSINFGSATSGFYSVGGTNAIFSSGGTAAWAITSSALTIGSNHIFAWTSTTNAAGTADTILARDAANTIAQRNTTNAQTFRVYHTYTDASNYERLSIDWTASTLRILTEAAGTGTGRNMIVGTQTAGTLSLRTVGTSRWTIDASGHFTAVADATYDIGASGATRPRSIYISANLTAGNDINAGQARYIGFSGRTYLDSASDGVLRIANNAGTDFNRLQFGGTSSSFPALKRSTVEVQTKLADDSAFTDHRALHFITTATDFMSKSAGTWANGAAAALGTLTNAPAAGDPTKWIPVDDNGTTRYVPAW